MGNSESQKISQPQESLIVSVQHKELESLHDCEELRQLKQLPKTVPLRPSTSYPFQSQSQSHSQLNPADNIRRKSSLSDPINNREIRENDIDSTHKTINQSPFLLTPSLIGSNYSNTSTLPRSDISKSKSKSNESNKIKPFNPNTLRPPKLASEGLDILYKHLREHFTSLAVKVDCNQVSCTFKIQEMDEELAITRANMIDIDYTTNQIQKTITSMKLLTKQILILQSKCALAVSHCNSLWKLLPNRTESPRSLSIFNPNNKIRLIIMEGAMVRLGSYLKGSKKRWVILYIDGLMAYYNGEKQTELKGVIDLYNATEVIPSDISHLMITVKKGGINSNKLNSWHFKCPSPIHVTKWLDAIRSLHFIRARSKLKYCENIPTSFLRDNTFKFMEIKSNVFNIVHLFNINGYCYEIIFYTNNNQLYIKIKGYLQNIDYNIKYIDYNIIRNKFDINENEFDFEYTKLLKFKPLNNDIIAIQYCYKYKQIFYATQNCIFSIQINDIINAINDNKYCVNNKYKTIINIAQCKDNNSVQRIKIIADISICNYSDNKGLDISVIFICDYISHCLWCYNLNENYPMLIRLINTPSPNSICILNNILYITSLQCGIYYIHLKDINFAKAFSSPSFFSPFIAKGLQIFENIVLKQIINMELPPNDLLPYTYNKQCSINNINTSMISNISKSQSPTFGSIGSTSSIHSNDINNNNARMDKPNMLFVIDIEYQLYMIRLTDLVLISFGIIENSDKIFYYHKFDNLYITQPINNKIQCIANIYHEIISLRSNTNSALFGSTLNTPTLSSMSSPNSTHSIEPIKEINESKQVQKVNTIKQPIKSNSTQKKHKYSNKNNKKKQLSNADIKALMHNNNDDNINSNSNQQNNSTSKKTKKICFPKSLYLVYQILNENENELNNNSDNNSDNDNMNDMNNNDIEMEILVEVDNMLQSYMLSELRQHSKKLLNYTKRNYSFLYLYTSPYDGQSMYRELDKNYESSVPAKNLIQHSSIGPVILVKLKSPTKEQIKKQKERDAKIKKRKNKQKNKKLNLP